MKWDLFNPIPEFKYKNMSSKLDISTLDNPNIQVIWEDSSENFTQEKIKSVRHYFQKKYNSTNINIITKSKVNEAGNYTKPELRKRIFNSIKSAAVQGTGAGQWSARKAQLMAKRYKAAGGGYK
jgi:hypothetical protein